VTGTIGVAVCVAGAQALAMEIKKIRAINFIRNFITDLLYFRADG
jgi:hypothetical protein